MRVRITVVTDNYPTFKGLAYIAEKSTLLLLCFGTIVLSKKEIDFARR